MKLTRRLLPAVPAAALVVAVVALVSLPADGGPATRPAGSAAVEPWPEAKIEAAADKLSPEAYNVLREEGTEPAFSSDLLKGKGAGVYACKLCDLPVYSSETKFDSGTGWPSFYQPIEPGHVAEVVDRSMGMTRTEVECARCGSHLGHVFDDGPEPTGLRHCINGVALTFRPAE